MFNKQIHTHPPEVVASLHDLMEYEYLVQSHQLLPDHPVYSILAGRHASKLRGRGLDFEEVRQYVAGDDIRNIDWRVTARVGKTHSKVDPRSKQQDVLWIATVCKIGYRSTCCSIKCILYNKERRPFWWHYLQ